MKRRYVGRHRAKQRGHGQLNGGDGSASDVGLERRLKHGTAGSTARRGLTWALGGQWVSYAIQLATTAILARLLTPEDFGIVAMALTLTLIVDQFRDVGVSQAVVQRENLTWAQVNGLFWFNVCAGVGLAGVIMATGPLLALFYGEPQLTAICLALGAGYLIHGMSVQHNALLARKMHFSAIAVRTGLARLMASVSAVVAAVLGAGLWSLVILQVAMPFFATLFVWWAVSWRPGPPRYLRDSLPLLRFGAVVSAGRFLHHIARQADNIIIGKVLGADALGIYSRAYSLLTLPLRQLTRPLGTIMIPMLSALQNEPRRYTRLYCTTLAGLAHVGMPTVIFLAVAAPEIIQLLLGDQWGDAVPIFRLLAIAGFFQIVSSTTGWLFVSSGRAGPYTRWAATSTVLTVLSFIVGIQWGASGVAGAYAISQGLLTIPAFGYACTDTPVRLRVALLTLIRPIVIAALIAMPAYYAHAATAGPLQVGSLLVTGFAAAVAWIAIIAAWPRARHEVTEMVHSIRRSRVRPS